MKLQDALESLARKFSSSNSINVECATITRDEWESLLTGIQSASFNEDDICHCRGKDFCIFCGKPMIIPRD